MEQTAALRRASTPVDHLIAEMAAMPIASHASLELAVTRLVPQLPDRLPSVLRGVPRTHRDQTAELWRRTERDLLVSFPAVSLDELIAIRDMLWFQSGAEESPSIGDYLKEMALLFLEDRGSSLAPTLPSGHLGRADRRPTSAESRRTLRWLTLALPPDLLCAAAARGDDALELALTNPTIDRMLEAGRFAEPHLHLGAGIDFDTIWHALVANVGLPSFELESLFSPGAEFDDGRELGQWLIRGCIGRLILSWYLRDRYSGAGHGTEGGRRRISFGDYADFDDYFEDPDNWRRTAPAAGASDYVAACAALDDLRRGVLDTRRVRFGALQSLYRRMTDLPAPESAATLAEVESFDPLARIFAVPRRLATDDVQARSTRTPEQRFIGKGMRYLERAGDSDDRPFAVLFWQVVRVRCMIYRHLVQRPLTPGLQWFVRFYDRARPARHRLETTAFLDSAADISGQGRGLMSLEVRTSPWPTLEDNLALARDTAAWATQEAKPDVPEDRRHSFIRGGVRALVQHPKVARHSHHPLEVGVVLHFTKDRGGGAMAGLPSGHWYATHADPDPHPDVRVNTSGLRYSAYYMRNRASAVALARTLQRWPRSLFVIRGLDVCTDELGVPSWVIRPLFQRVRSSAQLAAVALDRLGEGPAPRLHTTVHAGEDFVHLATGLRNVDEAIDHLGLAEGDRIGHAIALGVDPCVWTTRIGRVAVPREVRMWDLLWEWIWIASHGGGSVPRHAFIERELSRLTELTFGEIIAPYRLEMLRSDLLDNDLLWELGWPTGAWHRTPTCPGRPLLDEREGADSTDRSRRRRVELLRCYLSNPKVFSEGRRVEWIDPSTEGNALQHLQDGLRRKVASMGLTIEVNPTSNLLIGDLGSLTQHPMWRLNPPIPDPSLAPVALCVGSDDPLIFASNLIEEYNVLYDGLMEAGLTDSAAREWLERVRRRGVESRFTIDPNDLRPINELPNPLRDYPTQLV